MAATVYERDNCAAGGKCWGALSDPALSHLSSARHAPDEAVVVGNIQKMLGQGIEGEVFTLMMPLIGEPRILTFNFNYSGFKKAASRSHHLMFKTIFCIVMLRLVLGLGP